MRSDAARDWWHEHTKEAPLYVAIGAITNVASALILDRASSKKSSSSGSAASATTGPRHASSTCSRTYTLAAYF